MEHDVSVRKGGGKWHARCSCGFHFIANDRGSFGSMREAAEAAGQGHAGGGEITVEGGAKGQGAPTPAVVDWAEAGDPEVDHDPEVHKVSLMRWEVTCGCGWRIDVTRAGDCSSLEQAAQRQAAGHAGRPWSPDTPRDTTAVEFDTLTPGDLIRVNRADCEGDIFRVSGFGESRHGRWVECHRIERTKHGLTGGAFRAFRPEAVAGVVR